MSYAGASMATSAPFGHTLPRPCVACYGRRNNCRGWALLTGAVELPVTSKGEHIMTDHPVARRAVLKSAGFGISAGLAAGVAAGATRLAAAEAGASGAIRSGE